MLAHAHQPFLQAIKSLFMESISHKQDGYEFVMQDGQRPYRILVSLMDKWEVGQPVLDKIFLDVLRCLKKESQLPEFTTEVRMEHEQRKNYIDSRILIPLAPVGAAYS
jgi:hypothetical protein